MGLRSALTKSVLWTKKHAPEVELIGELACIGLGVYFTRKAAQKELDILKKHNEAVEALKADAGEEMVLTETEDGTPEVQKVEKEVDPKKLSEVYANTGVELVKAYAPAAGCLMAGTFLGVKSYKTLKKREVAALGAVEGLRQCLGAYRKRVKDEIGDKREKQLYLGTQAKDITTVSDDEKVIEMIPDAEVMVEDVPRSPFAIELDNTCDVWDRSPEQMRMILEARESVWEHKLQVEHRVTLYDVIKDMGALHKVPVDIMPLVMRYGWVKDSGIGTGRIDFSIVNAYKDLDRYQQMNSVNYRFYPVIDFNVDGDLFDIEQKFGLNLFGIKR